MPATSESSERPLSQAILTGCVNLPAGDSESWQQVCCQAGSNDSIRCSFGGSDTLSTVARLPQSVNCDLWFKLQRLGQGRAANRLITAHMHAKTDPRRTIVIREHEDRDRHGGRE